MTHSNAWREPCRTDLGFLNTLSHIFASAQRRNPGAFPNLRLARRLFVASDYGGEHSESKYWTMVFLLADIVQCAAWQSLRAEVRAKGLLGLRRIAFKNINDSVRASALSEFLECANSISGVLIVFAIHKPAGSLFSSGHKLDPTDLQFEPLRTLSSPVAEKLMRVIHLLSLVIAGFSAPGQDVLWATDEDAIAANENRVRYLVDALARVSSNLLDHSLGHLRVATSKQDKGDLSLEDLLTIPDIAAGGIADALSSMFVHGAPPLGFEFPRSAAPSSKAKRVLDWFSDNTTPLKRLVIMIDRTADTHKLRATHLRFHGLRDAIYGM